MIEKMKKLLSFSKTTESSFISVFNSAEVRADIGKDCHATLRNQSKKYASLVAKRYGELILCGANKSTSLDNLYVALRYMEESESEMQRQQSYYRGEGIEGVIEDAITLKPEDASKKLDYYDVALIGASGSGKTTSLKYLALMAARGHEFRKKKRIPVLISLRERTQKIKANFILEEIVSFFSLFDFKSPEDITFKLLGAGSIFLLIDGIDELNESDQQTLIKELMSIKAKPTRTSSERNIICIAGKPHSLAQELPGFFKYNILPPNYKEKAQLIQNWFNDIDTRSGNQLVSHLINEKAIKKTGANPLLMSMICSLHYNGYGVPPKLDKLFERYLCAVLAKWDYFKGASKNTPLSDRSEKSRLMLVASIAAKTLLKNHTTFKSADATIHQACRTNDKLTEQKGMNPDEILESLHLDYGILAKPSRHRYSFTHPRVQEFLTAYWIVNNGMEIKFIDSMSNNLLRRSYVIEYISRNLTFSAANFLLKLHHKINYRSVHEIDLIKKILSDKETRISTKEKEKIVYLIVSKSQSQLDRFVKNSQKSHLANGVLAMEIPLGVSLQTVKNIYNCFKLFSTIIEDQFGKKRAMEIHGDKIPREFFFLQKGRDISHRIKRIRSNVPSKVLPLGHKKALYN